ncbi:MAG: PKD domain-containing protein, partial [Thermoplasmata archaeon]|nr:PKD domain-containing protein [Thermoplasmata archaeon]
MAEDIVVAEETGLLGGKLIPIIVIAIVIVGAGAGAYFFMFKDKEEEEDNNGTPIENPDENNTSGGGENITAKFTFTHDEKDHNGEISVKEAVHFDAADSTGGWFFEWDFGDAKFDTSNSSEVTHHYSQAGTYTV